MRQLQLEAIALDVLERFRPGAQSEDARVEIKREWPLEHAKAARQIGGHCNAGGGDPAIWIIGVDEKEGVIGAELQECSSWWTSVQKWFVEGSPVMVGPVHIPRGDRRVTAIAFLGDRIPYLVRNPAFNTPGGGPVEFEIPWREGTRTRTARRADLVRALGRQMLTPRVDVLLVTLMPAMVGVSFDHGPSHDLSTWRLCAKVAIVPEPDCKLRYLLHRSSINVALNPLVSTKLEPRLTVESVTRGDAALRVDDTIVEILGPTTVYVEAEFEFIADLPTLRSAAGTFELYPARDEPPIRVLLPPVQAEQYTR